MKKQIKIKICDTHFTGEHLYNNKYTKLLSQKYDLVFSDDPDYILFSVFGNENTKYTDEKYIKIFFTEEDLSPDFNLCDYAIGFDYLDYGDRYIRFPLAFAHFQLSKAMDKHLITDEDLAMKTGFCDFVVSNGGADNIREKMFRKLSEYKRVDSGGRFLNNVGGPVGSKLDFQKNHRFSLTFENGSSIGYTTEKIVDAFAAKTIPIYWGNPDIAKDFNPGSFINYHDYNDPDKLVERVIEVDQNEELYIKMLKTPIFANGQIPKQYRFETLLDFFVHIFEQPVEKASRRCHTSFRGGYIFEKFRYGKFTECYEKDLLLRAYNKIKHFR